MPNWAGGVLTAKGRALQAKVEAGQTLELTKMKLGTGTPEPEEIDNLTDLKQPQNIMGISSKTVENNVCEVTSVILTSNINTPFYAREWGLFANDPDEGEILYMYTTDHNPDYIPDKNSALVISASYALNIAVLNMDNIVVNIDPEGLITAGMLEKKLNEQFEKNHPIGSIYMSVVDTDPAILFGLGTWEPLPAGRVLLAQGQSEWDENYEAGSTGGEATHKLVPAELAEHNHIAVSNTTNINGQVSVGVFNAQMATFGHSGVITPVSTYPELYVPNNATRVTVPGGAVINANITPKITVNNTGSNQPHNNMQPYIAVYMWKRTA